MPLASFHTTSGRALLGACLSLFSLLSGRCQGPRRFWHFWQVGRAATRRQELSSHSGPGLPYFCNFMEEVPPWTSIRLSLPRLQAELRVEYCRSGHKDATCWRPRNRSRPLLPQSPGDSMDMLALAHCPTRQHAVVVIVECFKTLTI